MDLVIDLISLGRNAREESKIKVRQPLQNIILDAKVKDIIGDIDDLIKEELNVKEIIYMDDLSLYMNIEYKPNFKVCGKIFGKDMKKFTEYLLTITNEEVELLSNDKLVVNFNGNEYTVLNDYVERRVNSKEGYDVASANNQIIILNTNLTDELLGEGLARETISKVQNMRKTCGFEIMDRICIYYNSNDEYYDKVKNYIDFMKKETLAVDIKKDESINDYVDINGYEVALKLEKV